MAIFVNCTDQPQTIPDGREGSLIVPVGCEAVEGPDGILVARPAGGDSGDVDDVGGSAPKTRRVPKTGP